MSTVITNFDSRHVKFYRLSEMLTNTAATHKLSLLFGGHSLLMLGIRSLITIH